jgi:hypothetical protein
MTKARTIAAENFIVISINCYVIGEVVSCEKTGKRAGFSFEKQRPVTFGSDVV